MRLHEEACARNEESYRDPETGNLVFTAVKLRNRGYCCGSGCRHCPYRGTPAERKLPR